MKTIFDHYYKKYDAWYDRNKFAYLSELKAVREVLKESGRVLKRNGKIIIGIVDGDSFLGKYRNYPDF